MATENTRIQEDISALKQAVFGYERRGGLIEDVAEVKADVKRILSLLIASTIGVLGSVVAGIIAVVLT